MLSLIGCTQNEFTSHWRDREIAVDGDQEDWQGKLTVPMGKNIALGFMNDESNLYVTLSSSDRTIVMQIMRLGFTVWFDSKGGKKEVFGVKYPTGTLGMGGRPGLEEQVRSLQKPQLWVEVLGPGKDDIARLSVMDPTGIRVKTGVSADGRFVYELKIPLGPSPDSPYAVNTSPGATIGVGFETGGIDPVAMRSPMERSGMRGGGMPGGGGRPGGMRGGGQRGMMVGPFSYWTKVTLATNE